MLRLRWKRTLLAAVLGCVTTVGVSISIAIKRQPATSWLSHRTILVDDDDGSDTEMPGWLFLFRSRTGIAAHSWTYYPDLNRPRNISAPQQYFEGNAAEEYPFARDTWGVTSKLTLDELFRMKATRCNKPDSLVLSQDFGYEQATGWPLLALMYTERATWKQKISDRNYHGVWKLSESLPFAQQLFGEAAKRRLPGIPIWPGFAINSTLYGAAWWFVLPMPGWAVKKIRRRRRVSRGLCPACRYDLKHEYGDGCPECGWSREKVDTA